MDAEALTGFAFRYTSHLESGNQRVVTFAKGLRRPGIARNMNFIALVKARMCCRAFARAAIAGGGEWEFSLASEKRPSGTRAFLAGETRRFFTRPGTASERLDSPLKSGQGVENRSRKTALVTVRKPAGGRDSSACFGQLASLQFRSARSTFSGCLAYHVYFQMYQCGTYGKGVGGHQGKMEDAWFFLNVAR